MPKSAADWEIANTFFHANLLPCHDTFATQNLDEIVETFNNTIYDYFAETFGMVKKGAAIDENLKHQFIKLSKNELKRELKKLKKDKSIDNSQEIRYVARLLRDKISPNTAREVISTIDHDLEITKSFWGYCKRFLESTTKTVPTFTRDVCTDFFLKTFRCINKARKYIIPTWIPSLCKPTTKFDQSPPTYKEITKVIQRMKTSGSPCPLDQISIICFKRCPYLRTYLLEICKAAWNSKTMPKQWQRAVTILIHKKGQTDDPGNFRPITLEPVCLKVFTSLLRNRMFTFLLQNEYIESHVQKGFIPGLSGTMEHIAGLSYVINEARLKQRSVTITLIDLKNAFGEVEHQLIDCCLEYHHIPDHIKDLVKCLYGSFATAIATTNFTTNFISFDKGVLQGDCLSPLLFNMVVNTFIQYIKTPAFEQFGYKYVKIFTSRHWYQFADDAAAVTSLESENQILLNAFGRWCTWANMVVRVDKCHTFGMKKVRSAEKQTKPNLFINNKKVRAIEIGDSFMYLGRSFNFSMSSDHHKDKLIAKINEYMKDIDYLPLHPRFKVMIYNRFVLSKISWDLTISDITTTWVQQNLNGIVAKYIRTWLEFPISGTLRIVTLSKKRHGLNVVMPSARHLQCQVTYRNIQRASPNADVREIHSITSSKGTNMHADQFRNTKAALQAIRENTVKDINKLSTQSLIIKSIWEHALQSMHRDWFRAIDSLPRSIYNFTQRYLSNCLPNRSNSIKWGITDTATCSFCPNTQTLGHVVSSCKSSLHEGRFNWRHDSVLLNIANLLRSKTNNSVHCDIDGYASPSILTGDRKRPDIVVKHGNDLSILELTVGFETNLTKNTMRKNFTYADLIQNHLKGYGNINYLNLSMSACGAVTKDAINMSAWFTNVGLTSDEVGYLSKKIMSICMRSTYYIFCCRDKEWTKPELMVW